MRADIMGVSTHSRPKAAGLIGSNTDTTGAGFNTQPPEGGWAQTLQGDVVPVVSTHSRPKAAEIVL